MESQMWERIRDQDLDYADEDFGAFQEPMNVIGQEEALKLYDAGADIYLITNFSSPIYVTERMEIERGPEHYQMSTEELERFRNLEWEMQKYPQIQSLKEANLLLGTRRTFGIYQIRDGLPGENYAFMNMSFIESHGMQIKKEDYELVYVGELFGNMSLDDIFERFNIDRPEDFRGHSLSVSDIVVLNEGGKVTAHFVDSISFEQLDSFLNLEEQVLSELAYEVGERYFAIQRTEGGYDYSFYDEDFRLMDGGVYENGEISIEEAAEELLEDEGWTGERIRGDYDQLMEKVEEMDEVVMAEIQKSQGEYKPLAKVEELEEANYNMIDNVLNNMPPKKEPYLEYFAAECDEFHDMGAYEKSTDVNQIAAVYEKYRENPENAYRVCSMGIIYRDPEDSYYDDAEFAIVKGNTVLGNLMDDVRFYGELALIREGIEKIHDALPDYKYVPMRDVREAMYPEKMTTEQLAEALDEIAEAFDPYEYRDNVETGENTVQEVMLDLQSGNTHSYISYLKDIVDEECDQSVRAGVLIERLKVYEPEFPKNLEPMVYVNYCEESALILETYLGKMGLVLHTFANGWDETPVSVEGYKAPIKSIGNSTTTPRDLVSELDVKIILMALSESVGARLRENGFQCRTVEISIRDNGLYHFTRQCKLDRASNLTEEIARTAFELFQKNYNWEHPIRSLGVRGCDLVSEEMPYQLDLFMDETKREKIKKMDQVVDEIRGRFGYQSIQRAFMYQDKILAQLNAKEHTVHPQAYFHG